MGRDKRLNVLTQRLYQKYNVPMDEINEKIRKIKKIYDVKPEYYKKPYAIRFDDYNTNYKMGLSHDF